MSSWDEVDGRLRRRVTLEWGDGLSLALSNVEAFDAEYQGWMEELTGWYGGVDVSGTDTQRVLGHGLFPEPSLRTGRVLTLSGVLQLASERDRTVAERFVSGILGDGGFGTLTYEVESAPTLSAQVKLDGAVKTTPHGLDLVRFEAPLLAPDPFLVGEEQAVQIYPAGAGVGLRFPLATGDPAVVGFGAENPNTRAVLTNLGNAESYPLIVVAGDWPSGFVLVADTGETVEYPVPVWSQAPVTVDNGRGTIMQSGMDQSARATRRQWVGIPPGGTRSWVVKSLQPGDGYATIIHRDTYI